MNHEKEFSDPYFNLGSSICEWPKLRDNFPRHLACCWFFVYLTTLYELQILFSVERDGRTILYGGRLQMGRCSLFKVPYSYFPLVRGEIWGHQWGLIVGLFNDTNSTAERQIWWKMMTRRWSKIVPPLN